MRDLFAERVDYLNPHLLESELPEDPFTLFDAWLTDAFAARDRGELAEPTAMVLATVAAGRPSARTVLLKECTPEGFAFFTNYGSRKARELAADAAVALQFGWYALHRQVRVEGQARRVPRAESISYFATRPRGSQLGAWASAQSSEVASAEALERAYAEVEQRFEGVDVPCPEYWGGYRVVPELVEFWQGQPSRMHDRLVYRRSGQSWTISRLAP